MNHEQYYCIIRQLYKIYSADSPNQGWQPVTHISLTTSMRYSHSNNPIIQRIHILLQSLSSNRTTMPLIWSHSDSRSQFPEHDDVVDRATKTPLLFLKLPVLTTHNSHWETCFLTSLNRNICHVEIILSRYRIILHPPHPLISLSRIALTL